MGQPAHRSPGVPCLCPVNSVRLGAPKGFLVAVYNMPTETTGMLGIDHSIPCSRT